MQQRTAERLTLLDNDYTPIPNVDKLCQFAGWSTVEITEAEIRRWGRMSAFEATGLRLQDGLAAIDFDVNVSEVDELYESLLDTFPELQGALYRRGKGHKEAWFVRTSEPFGRIATATYADGDEGLTVEIFGGESPRQFGALGWHTKGELEYQWLDGSPLDVPLADLPELSVARFEEIARFCYLWLDARFERVRGEDVERTSASQIWDLGPDMAFVTREEGELNLDELRERLGGGGYYYLSASWLDGPVARNTRRCSATLDAQGGVAIWDSMTDHTHHEAALEPREVGDVAIDVGERLEALGAELPRTETVTHRPPAARGYLTAANGNIKNVYTNIAHWISQHMEGTIRLNSMQHHPWLMNDGGGVFPEGDGFPRQMTDVDDLLLCSHINYDVEDWIGQPFGKEATRDGVGMAAGEDPWDPLHAMFADLPAWDGEPRIDTWLLDYGGATVDGAHSGAYIRSVSRKWLIACVARAMRPGCKLDNILVIKGAQGVHREGKSSLLAALAGSVAPGADGQLFGDDMPKVGAGASDKAAKEWLAGIWIAEVAEMTAIGKADAEHVKSFISTTSDRYRVPYTSKAVTVQRRTVFAATTNHMQFLTDSTGNRRFWPVLAEGRFNVRGLRDVRLQIWAEARAAYEAGETWWFDYDRVPEDRQLYEDVVRAQEGACKDNPFNASVEKALHVTEDHPVLVSKCPTMMEIYQTAMDPSAKRIPRSDVHAMTEAIQAAGWVVVPAAGHKNNSRRYRRGPAAAPWLDANAKLRGEVVTDLGRWKNDEEGQDD